MGMLEYTKSKLSSVIELVENLQSGDFPHNNAPNVLDRIHKLLSIRLERLKAVHPDLDGSVKVVLCKEVLQKIFEVFPLLGFLTRSTDVRNSFELHGPFLRLVRRALGSDARLVISSEWDYSPFTYQMPDDLGLDDVVFIGIPASESCNGLTIPLAGHEFGHNIWRWFDFSNKYQNKVESEVVNYISDVVWDEFIEWFEEVGDKSNLTDMLGSQIWKTSWVWAMEQCEELFCDFIGLIIFKEAYLHAFAYLLAPGLPGIRSESYPNMKDRARALAKVANSNGIAVPPDFIDQFEDNDPPFVEENKFLLEISDAVTIRLIDTLADDAAELIYNHKLDEYSSEDIGKLVKNFSLGVPAMSPASVSSIVNAASFFSRNNLSEWEKRYPVIFSDAGRSNRMLSDLVYKSLEVLEIAERQGER